MRFVTFLSDFGLQDEFVGVCHAVIARFAPEARVIDVAHGVRGVRAGAAVLAQAAPYLPRDAVHLAVVDPGVGTERRPVGLSTSSGALLVGPDNGLLVEAADVLGGIDEAHELRDERYRLSPVSATFHGRDVFAPAAAHLAAGVPLPSFGPPVDPVTLERLPPPLVELSGGTLVADVLRTDVFGNVQLAAGRAELDALPTRVRVVADGGELSAVVGRTFADAPPGGAVVYLDSAGRMAVAVNGASADAALGEPRRVRIISD